MKKKDIPFWLGMVLGAVVAGFVILYPLEYYIMKPGNAYDISEYLQVEGGDTDDKGSLNMMTVSMSKASPLTYVYAQFKDYYELLSINEVRQEEEDEEEYDVRQNKLMTDSQFNALHAAFSYAALEYEVQYNGVYVLNILTGSAADGVLQPGDEIIEIDNNVITNQQMLVEFLADKGASDTVELVVNREDVLVTKTLTLKEIPNASGKVGLGITFVENKSITTNPHVNIAAEGIGGPSAGLMFTLEILNQLLPEDITKGYQVAGTGAILSDSSVGRIGGVEKKVVAANKAGMDIFFVPDDVITDDMLAANPNYLSNSEAAIETAKEIGTTMKIVPVKTLQDAIDYLASLEAKN